MDTQLTAWLNEGLKHYAAGDHARALESWHRILEVDPDHPGALEYVAFVRDTVRVDTMPPASTTAASESGSPTETMPPPGAPIPVAPTPSTSPPVDAGPGSRLLSTSWADLLGDDLAVPAPTPLASSVSPTSLISADAAVSPPESDSETPMTPDAVSGSPTAPLPAPEEQETPPEPGPPPAIARWASPRVAAPPPPPPAVGEFEPLQPFDLDASEPAPMSAAERPGAGFTAPPAPPSLPPTAPLPPPTITVDATTSLPAISVDAAAARPPGITAAAPLPDAPPEAPGPAAAPAPVRDPWSNVPRTATPSPRPFPDLPPTTSPALRPTPGGEVYRGGATVDVVPADRGTAPLEERIVRQSVRYDEPVEKAPSFMAAVVAADIAARSEKQAATTAPPPPTSSPWDGDPGPAATLDLDARPPNSPPARADTSASSTMALSAPPPTAPPTSAPPTSAPPSSAPLVDELEALMTGARELFALGDFSGSLELVEKVLQREPSHDGARAYFKRNESTLLKMYESKLGSLGTIPSQLVPPDEVIWLNMHHRAGFILSQVDGTLSYEDLLEVSGMDRFDTIRILAELVQNGIIGVR